MSKRIVQFDNEEYYTLVSSIMLTKADCEIVASAVGRKQAIDLIAQIEQQKIIPDLAIVDTFIDQKHSEGAIIASRLKVLVPEIKIIAYTIIDDEEIPWADAVAIKSLKDTNRTLVKALEEILGIQISINNKLDVN